jgi:hypothetical protein
MKLIENDSGVLDLLSFGEGKLPLILHYFPYLFAALPYAVSRFVVAAFPLVSTFYLEWALSERIHRLAVATMQKCGTAPVECFSGEDLDNFLCDFVGQIIQTPESRDKILKVGDVSSTERLAHCVEILLRRRKCYLGQLRGPNNVVAVVKRKIARLETNIDDLLKWAQRVVSSDAIFPSLRDSFEKFEYPKGVVDMNQTDDYIRHLVKKQHIHELLPLFQLGEGSVTETHWVNLLQAAHREERLADTLALHLGLHSDPCEYYRLLQSSFTSIMNAGRRKTLGPGATLPTFPSQGSTTRPMSMMQPQEKDRKVKFVTKDAASAEAKAVDDPQLKSILEKLAILL